MPQVSGTIDGLLQRPICALREMYTRHFVETAIAVQVAIRTRPRATP